MKLEITRGLRLRRGQGLVEIALVLPLFLTLVCAIIDFARAYNVQETLHRITKEAVNYGTQVKADGTRPTADEVQAWLLSAVMPPLVRSGVVVEQLDVKRTDAKGRRSVFAQIRYDMHILTPVMTRWFPDQKVALYSSAQLPYTDLTGAVGAPPAPPVSVAPDGTVVFNKNGTVTIRILGKQLQYGAGGPTIPVTLQMKHDKGDDDDDDDDGFEKIFGGNPVNGGEEMTLSGVKKNDNLALSARARYQQGSSVLFDQTYVSNDPRPFTDASDQRHALVLRDGDPVPDKPTFGDQTALASYLAPYVDAQTKLIKLGPNDAIVLWEFNQTYGSPASDFQDLAVLMQIN
jgi:Flp pilus assembly protein TadG